MKHKILHITLLRPFDLFKGDFKVLQHRLNHCYPSTSYDCHLLTFQVSFFKNYLALSAPSPELSTVSSAYKLHLSIFLLLSFLPRALLRFIASPYPLQSLFSLLALYSVHSNPEWIKYFSSYDSYHLYHIRTYWLSRLIPPSKKLIYDLIDSYTLNLQRRLNHGVFHFKQILLTPELFLIRRLESSFLLNTPALLCTVSPVDLQLIKPQSPFDCTLRVIPQGFDPCPFSPPPPLTNSLNLIFFGNLSYHPNRQAVQFLAKFFRHLCSQDHLNVILTVAGRSLSPSLKRLCELSHIKVISPVDDMKMLVQSHHLSIVPLFSGSGLQSKVIESMTWSRPVLLTPLPYSALINPSPADFYQFTDQNSLYYQLKSILSDPCTLVTKSWDVHHYSHSTYVNGGSSHHFAEFLDPSQAHS